MLSLPRRRHLVHSETPGGTCHVTWRLERHQEALRPAERTIVLDVLRRATEFGCAWHAAVVMDDHVHALFTPSSQRPSSRLLHAWKSVSAHLIIKSSARTAPLWQAEYYQRWLASPRLLPICTSYILANPARKWP